MRENDIRGLKCRPTNNDDNAQTVYQIAADGGVAADLSDFQIRALAAAASLNDSDDVAYGLAIKRELEQYYGDDVNHGRLYPNLDELEEKNLIETSQVDRRTKRYTVSDEGRKMLTADLHWLARSLGLTLQGDDHGAGVDPVDARGDD